MTTTTIRISDTLRSRVAAAAKDAGKTAHAYIVDAIDQQTQQDQRRREFITEAERRLARMRSTGKGILAADMHDYAMALARGEDPKPPRVKNLGKNR